jgi:hypothetical protein
MTNFDDLTNRVLDKLDILDVKIDDLCNWKVKMQTEWAAHSKSSEDREIKKEKKFYYIVAIMGVAIAVFEIASNITFK